MEEHGPLAQLAEQLTLNQQVTGSIPVRLTFRLNVKFLAAPTGKGATRHPPVPVAAQAKKTITEGRVSSGQIPGLL